MSEFIESPAGGVFVRPEAVTAVTADGNQVSIYLDGGVRMPWSSTKDQATATEAAADLVAQLNPKSSAVRQTASKESKR